MKDHALSLAGRADSGQGKNVLREYLQARILEMLQREQATRAVVFQGGTALRFLYDVPRYSEDLDFTLEGDVTVYDPRGWLKAMERQFQREGYQTRVALRQRGVVHGGWLRFSGLLWEAGLSRQPTENLAIKIEVDTNPPAGAVIETRTIHRHVTVRLRHHDRASLLAGKLAAILCRPYTKGRDVYDLGWYLADRAIRQRGFRRRVPGPAELVEARREPWDCFAPVSPSLLTRGLRLLPAWSASLVRSALRRWRNRRTTWPGPGPPARRSRSR